MTTWRKIVAVLALISAMASALPAVAQTRPSHGIYIAPTERHVADRNRAPKAWDDGIVVNQFDDPISGQTFWSDGRSATRFGSIVIYNDGTLATQSGDRTIFANGRSCAQHGATTICD